MRLTGEDLQAIEAAERDTYYALWGYDGLGGIGPKLAYERLPKPKADQFVRVQSNRGNSRAPFGAKRNHSQGHGWKSNHQS